MSTARERREADLFFADLMGPARPRVSRAALHEQADQEKDLKSGRVVFFDEDTLEFIEGWTRANAIDAVFLVNRGAFDPIRADGRRRARLLDEYIRRTMAGERDLMAPVHVFDASLHTAPLDPNSPGDWDDLMIARLTAAGRAVTIQREADQWTLIRRLFDSAMQDARTAATARRPAREFVAFFVLDTVNATLTMVQAANVTMQGNHAVIPIARVRGTNRVVLPGGDAGQRVIGDIHTHVLLDPLIDLTSTAVGTRMRSTTTSMRSGVSDVDVASATNDRLVVYAIDSKWLHRANPDGTRQNKLPRSGNVLRQALKVFGRER